MGGFVGAEPQGLLVAGLVRDQERALLELWAELEPFSKLKKPGEFARKVLATYPDVNLLEESRKVDTWWFSNPKKRRKSVTRFLNAWFSSAQDKAATDKRQAKAKAQRDSGDPTASTASVLWGQRRRGGDR